MDIPLLSSDDYTILTDVNLDADTFLTILKKLRPSAMRKISQLSPHLKSLCEEYEDELYDTYCKTRLGLQSCFGHDASSIYSGAMLHRTYQISYNGRFFNFVPSQNTLDHIDVLREFLYDLETEDKQNLLQILSNIAFLHFTVQPCRKMGITKISKKNAVFGVSLVALNTTMLNIILLDGTNSVYRALCILDPNDYDPFNPLSLDYDEAIDYNNEYNAEEDDDAFMNLLATEFESKTKLA